ncbi:ATP-binding cassette domain-containing protein [Umezawaea sp.]|uniref:ABC transporter ATP-binding protein/permease n=1 Tax=Umezawaea sp. TaxID=1955258 RepID=UPI002ED63B6B
MRVVTGLRIRSTDASWVARKGGTVLRPTSVDIGAGQPVAIIGPSGAGKTTLLEILAGIRVPSAGQVRHECADPAGTSPGIGFVPQDDLVHPRLPLDRTLACATRLRSARRLDAAEVDRAVTDVLAVLGLAHRATRPVGGLSGGERKRASIAVELVGRPPVLFLDEPTSGLDPATGRELVRHLKAIAARGSTVVFTTHNPADTAWCEHLIAVAPGGRLAFTGPPARALEHFSATSVEEIYDRLSDEDLVWEATGAAVPVADPRRQAGGSGAVRQWWLLTQRTVGLLVRNRLTAAILVGSPVVIAVMFLMLFRPRAFDAANPSPSTTVMILFWIAFGGFFFGLTYGLSQICDEFPILRAERRAGLRLVPYVLSKITALLPPLCAVDALLLVLLRVTDRLPSNADAGALFLTLALTSLCALTLGLLCAAAVDTPSQAALMVPVLSFPQVLFVGAFLPVPVMADVGRWLSAAMTNRWAFEALGAIAGLPELWAHGGSPLGPPLLASYGDSFDGPPGRNWVVLAAFAVAFAVGAVAVLRRKVGVRR